MADKSIGDKMRIHTIKKRKKTSITGKQSKKACHLKNLPPTQRPMAVFPLKQGYGMAH